MGGRTHLGALGAIRLNQLDRQDIADWYDQMAAGGLLNNRSSTIIRRVLRAALEDAVDEGLIRRNPAARVPVPKKVVKGERFRAVDAWDDSQIRAFLPALEGHRVRQREERLLAGPDWLDQNMVLSTQSGNWVSPRSFDQTLQRLVKKAEVPRLTSHGLRHTAATHMVRQATDRGELRTVADVLGHSPDMRMKTYAHALPDSLRAVSDRIGERVSGLRT